MLLLHYIEQIWGPNSKGQHSIYEGIHCPLIFHHALWAFPYHLRSSFSWISHVGYIWYKTLRLLKLHTLLPCSFQVYQHFLQNLLERSCTSPWDTSISCGLGHKDQTPLQGGTPNVISHQNKLEGILFPTLPWFLKLLPQVAMVFGSITFKQILLNTQLNLIRNTCVSSCIRFWMHNGNTCCIMMW